MLPLEKAAVHSLIHDLSRARTHHLDCVAGMARAEEIDAAVSF